MKINRLSQSAFAPFGDVIEARPDQAAHLINDGYTERYDNLAKIDTDANGGRTITSIFRSTPLPTPIRIEKMERHPLSSQAFMPLSDEPYLVVVAPPGDFDERAIKAFQAAPHQGVNYHKGTWHHFSLALDTTSDFLVIDRGGAGENCDEVTLNTSLILNP